MFIPYVMFMAKKGLRCTANSYLFTAYAETEIEREALDAGAKGTINKITDWDKTMNDILNAL